ncbi:YggT family protein [Litorivicinus lipolyticus]|jgi:YggT family protein|uniref:YggT family protein n=1 Tax=Litorivicinus lipolyticus TaxID=418701 RepID=UPI003B5C617F
MSQALIGPLNSVFSLIVFFLVLRLVLQAVQANYYNPICQGINKLSAPLLAPTARLIPDVGPISLNTLVIAVTLQALFAGGLAYAVYGQVLPLVMLVLWSLLSVIGMVIKLFFFALIIMIILSWVAPQADHPGAELVWQLTEPLMAPVRKVMPDLGGLDLSPIVVFLLIQMFQGSVLAGLARALQMPTSLFMGL